MEGGIILGDHGQKTKVVEMSVVMFSDGSVSVHGPLHDKVLCLGLFRVAEDVVLKHKVEQSHILAPNFIPPVGIKPS